MNVKVTGIDRLQNRLKEMFNGLDRVVDGALEQSAYSVKDEWINDAKHYNLDEGYILSINVTKEPVDGYYVGPTISYAATDKGIKELDELEEGDYITYIARCMVHKYYREVKREANQDSLKNFAMQPPIELNLEKYKNIIKETVRNEINNFMRGF